MADDAGILEQVGAAMLERAGCAGDDLAESFWTESTPTRGTTFHKYPEGFHSWCNGCAPVVDAHFDCGYRTSVARPGNATNREQLARHDLRAVQGCGDHAFDAQAGHWLHLFGWDSSERRHGVLAANLTCLISTDSTSTHT
jgi:hypothetical protein